MLNVDAKEFEYIKSVTWKEVFDMWRDNEAHQQKWIEEYRERGFDSWEEWRKTYTEPLGCEQGEWSLYRIVHPMETIPTLQGGPFRTWIEQYYNGEQGLTFSKVMEQSELQNHEKINQLAKNFPEETSLIGLVTSGSIVIIEGMHRCCALTLVANRGEKIESDVSIALAEFRGEKLPTLGQVRKGNESIA